MRRRNSLLRFSSKLVITVAAAAMLSACSDSLERFQNFGANNPSDADPVYTASVPAAKKAKPLAPVSQADDEIASTPLELPSRRSKPVYDYSKKKKPTLSLAQKDVSAPVEELDPQADIAAVEQVEPAPIARKTKTVGAGKGAIVRVESGMTLYSVARANNVSVDKLARANGLRAPYTLAVGRKLVIPGKSRAIAPETVATQRSALVQDVTEIKPQATPAVVRSVANGEYNVASGDTLYSIGRKFGVSPFIIADANGLKKNSTLSVGQSLRIPGAKSEQVVAKIDNASEPAAKTDAQGELAIGETNNEVPAIETKPVQENKLVLETKPVEEPAIASPGMLSMRWPVNGKVISEFGSKPNGLKNEGINISVPEGTSIRAAEGGVVAYAGNELKGYGNLVLIRHEGGVVTAYAHAKELGVKRGDTVKRGDVIAKAGQTGAVSTPQLHFEVRKGATAMDPLKFIGKSTASN